MRTNHHDTSVINLWHFAYQHLKELRTPYGFAASDASTGLYNTLFGRDSLWMLIFLIETTKLNSSNALNEWIESAGSDIISNLCEHQGVREFDSTEEQPGKIIHEFRKELDERLRELRLAFDEKGRFYGGFDQTFLFVTAYKKFSEVFPKNNILEKAWPNVQYALEWIHTYADDDDDGLFEYRRRNPNNLLNQVWKDSFDSIVQTGVDLPVHPIAWIEVQGYAYLAFLDAEWLYRERGNIEQADIYKQRAIAVKKKVNEQFWLASENCYAIGLDGEKRPITMISSNAGHALWTGVVDSAYTHSLVNRLMQPDMNTKYGVRTLSSNSLFYAPFAYHRGCIWPFDNGVFVMGLLNFGYEDEALRVINGVIEAIGLLNSPIELYIALDSNVFVQPTISQTDVLALRRADQENRNQGWTAAALVYFAAILTKKAGIDLPEI